jgi:hypothetical protein
MRTWRRSETGKKCPYAKDKRREILEGIDVDKEVLLKRIFKEYV